MEKPERPLTDEELEINDDPQTPQIDIDGIKIVRFPEHYAPAGDGYCWGFRIDTGVYRFKTKRQAVEALPRYAANVLAYKTGRRPGTTPLGIRWEEIMRNRAEPEWTDSHSGRSRHAWPRRRDRAGE